MGLASAREHGSSLARVTELTRASLIRPPDPNQARTAFRRATEIDPGMCDAWMGMKPWRGAEILPGPHLRNNSLQRCPLLDMDSYHHYAGTCRMGVDDAVVDPESRSRR